jgi:hypothetical protein
MRQLPSILAMTLAVLTTGAARAAAQEAPPGGTSNRPPPFENPAISTALTCSELLSMLHGPDRRGGGMAITWLDGYYSAKAGLQELSAGWSRTVDQGVGGTCAISVNASRPVLDVIAQIHRDYGSTPPAKP